MIDLLITASTHQRIMFYKKREYKLSELLFPNSDIELSNEFDRWDIVSHNKKQVLELKIRDFSLEFFFQKYNGSYLIEQDKYYSLIKKAGQLGYKPVYVFGFTDYKGDITAYGAINLSLIDVNSLRSAKVWCPKDSINTLSEKVLKDCFFISQNQLNENNNVIKYLSKPACINV